MPARAFLDGSVRAQVAWAHGAARWEPHGPTLASTVVAAYLVLSRGSACPFGRTESARRRFRVRADEDDGFGRDGPIVGLAQIRRLSDRREAGRRRRTASVVPSPASSRSRWRTNACPAAGGASGSSFKFVVSGRFPACAPEVLADKFGEDGGWRWVSSSGSRCQ